MLSAGPIRLENVGPGLALCDRARLTLNQSDGQDRASPETAVGAVQPIEYALRGEGAKPTGVLVDHGQRGAEHVGEREISVAGDREITGADQRYQVYRRAGVGAK